MKNNVSYPPEPLQDQQATNIYITLRFGLVNSINTYYLLNDLFGMGGIF